jgi:glycosyltransferase involved in cell wall biosynthesis
MTMECSLRLLLVLGSLESLYVDASARELKEIFATADRSWQIHLASPRLIEYKGLSFDYQSHRVPFTPAPNSVISRTMYLMFLLIKSVSIVKKYRIHLVMAKSGHLLLGPVAYLASRITHRKCIIRVNEDTILDIILFIKTHRIPFLSNKTILTIIEKSGRGIENILFRQVDWTVTHGPMDYERIKRVTNKVAFIPLWIDIDAFKPASKPQVTSLREKLVKRSKAKVVLFVGRLHSNKDPATLLRAFKKLSETRSDVVLVVIGTSPEEKTYFELAKQLGITEDVMFLGYVNHDEIAKYYSLADVYVLTSIWEEWSNTIMEAMAAGVPVVVSNVGANPYMVKDGETGFLFPRGDSNALAEKTAYVLDHPDEMVEISRRARLSIQKYTKKKIGEAHKRVIREVVAGRQP